MARKRRSAASYGRRVDLCTVILVSNACGNLAQQKAAADRKLGHRHQLGVHGRGYEYFVLIKSMFA